MDFTVYYIYGGRQYEMAYNHFAPLHNITFINLRTSHFQQVIDNTVLKKGGLEKLKLLASTLYSTQYKMTSATKITQHISFCQSPTKKRKTNLHRCRDQKLWDNSSKPFVDSALV